MIESSVIVRHQSMHAAQEAISKTPLEKCVQLPESPLEKCKV